MPEAITTPAVDDRPPPGPNAVEQRNAALEKANATLVARNRNLMLKSTQAEAAFNLLAERMYAMQTPPIAEIERIARYFHDTQLFEPDFVWPIGPADGGPADAAGQGSAQ